MTTREAIIKELYDTKFVENYAKQFCGQADRVYFEDIVSELYLIICELPASTVTNIYNGCGINCFRKYVSGIVFKQLCSTNSRIYRKYTRHVYRETPTDNITTLCHEETE